jgi:hypothetical protein
MTSSQNSDLISKLSPVPWAVIGSVFSALVIIGASEGSSAVVALTTVGALAGFYLSGKKALEEAEMQSRHELPPDATASLPIARDKWIGVCMVTNWVIGITGILQYLATLSVLEAENILFVLFVVSCIVLSGISLKKKIKPTSIALGSWRKKMEPPHEADKDFLFWKKGDEVELATKQGEAVEGVFQSFTNKTMIIKVSNEPETLREFNTADLDVCLNPKAERRKKESRTKELKEKVENRYQKKLEAVRELSLEDLERRLRNRP